MMVDLGGQENSCNSDYLEHKRRICVVYTILKYMYEHTNTHWNTCRTSFDLQHNHLTLAHRLSF